MVIGPPGTYYNEGMFRCELTFPDDFPNMPPAMKFLDEVWHPNIYPDGKVCISILHPPGVDEMNAQETAEERWRPILGVEAVLISVISMLADPNIESPANIDAATQFRDDKKGFRRKVRRCVAKTLEE
ncbi:Ube2g1 [Symbiodinium sp. KB8]|nr:Ube2g1 [Symbiodinium sp. KB8]